MECHRIQEKLSAYAENIVSSEEKKQIDGHLITCPKCSLYLEELKKTIAYIQGLEEIEPPPWLAQKVMSRVREESATAKKGIIQKLFFPLHIKVPIEVIATIAIAVTTLYVYKTIQPDMRLTETPSQQVIISEQEEKKSALKSDELFYKDTFSKAPEPAKKQRIKKENDVFVEKKAAQEAPESYKYNIYEPVKPEKRQKFEEVKETPAGKPRTQMAPDDFAEVGTLPKEPYRALDMKAEEKPEGFVPESKGMIDIKKYGIRLNVHVTNIKSAKKEIEKTLMQLNGKVIKKETLKDKAVLTAEIDYKKLKELNEKIRLIGIVTEEETAPELLEDYAARFRGDVKIKIEIVKDVIYP